MAHLHSVYDTDIHFKIDPITKKIECEAQKKVRFTIGDTGSERVTFEMKRFVEGHDMNDCNVVEVHYNNIDAIDKQKQSKSYFAVEDLQISQESDDVVIFSWLVQGTATKYVGTLGFSVRFACITDSVIEYQWSTDINNSISVGDTIFNSEYIATEYEDALAAWKADIEKKIANITCSAARCSEVVLSADEWQGEESPFSQVVSINGVTEKTKVILDLNLEQIWAFKEKNLTFIAENDGGVVTVCAYGQKPQNDYTIQVTLLELTEV